MINCMIISPNHEDLSKYFVASSGNTISVDYSYISLQQGLDNIMNSTIKIDKLVMVIKPSSNINYKNEVRALAQLLSDKVFFKVNDIWVFGEEDDYTDSVIQMMKSVLVDVNGVNTFYKVLPSISSTDIYKEVVGIVDSNTVKTSRKIVYRVQVGDESKVGYSPREREDNIEPDIEGGYLSYEKHKDSVYKIMKDVLVSEIPPKEIQKGNVELPETRQRFNDFPNIILVAGTPKSGTSIMSLNIVDVLGKSLVYDMSKVNSTESLLNKIKTKFNPIEVIQSKYVVLRDTFNSDSNKYVRPSDLRHRFSLLDFIISNDMLVSYDTMVIDCDLDDVDTLVKIINRKLKYVVFTCESRVSDFNMVKHYLTKEYPCTRYLFLNEYYTGSVKYDYISVAEVSKETDVVIIPGSDLIDYMVPDKLFV